MNSVICSAPGRVNLMGEHTDYNGGFVLPTTIPQRTTVRLIRRTDGFIRVTTDIDPQGAEYTLGQETRRGDWADYVQGVTWALGAAGHRITGCDLSIESEVPVGAGLSSSAALEVALLRAMREAFALSYDDVALAMLGRSAENGFVGAPVGILDYMACSLGDPDQALFVDTRGQVFEKILLPANAELLVINSGIEHAHASGDYRLRKAECDQAATLLGFTALRDVTDLSLLSTLPPLLARRARHVVSENERVLRAVEALKREDIAALGKIFIASHISQRDDFEVSVPEVDALVAVALKQPGVLGARLTGGGFGGSIVVLVKRGQAAAAGDATVAEFNASGAGSASVLVPAGAQR